MKQNDQNKLLERLKNIQDQVAESCLKSNRTLNDVNIMAVTKTVPPEFVNLAIDNGINLIGENKVQEFLSKYEDYHIKKQGIHFIGHLQTNKVKYIIDKVNMIESVSSFKLANEINKRAKENNLFMNILLEVNIGQEPSKQGLIPTEVMNIAEQITQLTNVKLCGVMCIPPKDNTEFYFDKMNTLFNHLKDAHLENSCIRYLSMGMSSDYQMAIKHNSNIVRIGSALFGERNIGG
ncbi:YggS family pyridoxal phosphate-dependent enzyme [Paludicola sp. MB14-C6]|uniref:YggS family pyridoxal phosphate-dependent enzyme n=1 Tax=Paludihabitans sp. MB14-C6 TaxID=3070656 RepID=UPI0027DD2432|nr:YggS family pyridoxal phosphate-dependent enzyme [Paludicola sp. MB14-C6]WMJ23110.1 YggS family pyridoxal phosphate-dependent enzyme [Paludicola sp. MB14-C6]